MKRKVKKPEFYDCFRKKDLNSVDKNSVVSFDKPYCLLSSTGPDHQKFTTTRAFAILNKGKSIRKETRISKHLSRISLLRKKEQRSSLRLRFVYFSIANQFTIGLNATRRLQDLKRQNCTNNMRIPNFAGKTFANSQPKAAKNAHKKSYELIFLVSKIR